MERVRALAYHPWGIYGRMADAVNAENSGKMRYTPVLNVKHFTTIYLGHIVQLSEHRYNLLAERTVKTK